MKKLYFISIHALLAESDKSNGFESRTKVISIHALLAESDNNNVKVRVIRTNFYPRSPCGERPKPCTRLSGRDTISIHALLAESDRNQDRQNPERAEFLSTLSLRRATVPLCDQAPCKADFYPRSPCGERPSSTVIVILRKNFYPRSPCGERPL